MKAYLEVVKFTANDIVVTSDGSTCPDNNDTPITCEIN